jgi:hypothetical protein
MSEIKNLATMEIYDIMYDVAMTVKVGNSYKTHFIDYKTAAKKVKWDKFSILHDEIILTVPPGEKVDISSIVFTGYKPFDGNVEFSIGDIRPKENPISPQVSHKTQFCHCPLNDLVREGCHCGGI